MEVEYECWVKIPICTIFDPIMSMHPTPQNQASSLGGHSCHWNSSQMMADRDKYICIVMHSEVMGCLLAAMHL